MNDIKSELMSLKSNKTSIITLSENELRDYMLRNLFRGMKTQEALTGVVTSYKDKLRILSDYCIQSGYSLSVSGIERAIRGANIITKGESHGKG